MFALAVADALVCVCSVPVFSIGVIGLVTRLAFFSTNKGSITFSMFLLVFLSIERLVAVGNPHFSMDPRRTKIYSITIVLIATIFTTVSGLSKVINYGMFVTISELCVSIISTCIMITCYILMTVAEKNSDPLGSKAEC